MTTTIKKEDVKAAAAGQWQRVFETLGFPDIEIGVHGPCPKCGGTDRFRLFDDFNETGGMICGAGGCNVASGRTISRSMVARMQVSRSS